MSRILFRILSAWHGVPPIFGWILFVLANTLIVSALVWLFLWAVGGRGW